MWKCPRPRPNHKGPPQLGLCRGDPINTVSSPVFSLLAGWLRRAACNAGMESCSNVRGEAGAPRPHTSLPLRRNPSHCPVFLHHARLQVMQCPLSSFKEFVVVPVGADGAGFLCAVLKYSKVACERHV